MAAIGLLMPVPARAIGYDAIFYRARAGFGFCYSFAGTAGWSLRPIEGRITHDGRDPCPQTGLPADQAAATHDCAPGGCHADCASYVRKSWAAGTGSPLTPIETPSGGNCANPSDYGAVQYVHADQSAEDIATALADARPGDWCSNPDHVLMIVSPESPGSATWTTFEANSSAVGIGTRSVTLSQTWMRSRPRNDCGFPSELAGWKASGCWHPSATRTAAPVLTEPSDGGRLSGADDLVVRFRRPEDLPALADYLVWFRWREGGTDEDPVYAHRLVRIPAFSYRADPARRLATFPERGGDEPPVDLADVVAIQVDAAALAHAPVGIPTDFKDEATGEITSRWAPNQNLAPRPPATFSETGFTLAGGRTYSVRVRVERYGVMSADGRSRTPMIPACKADSHGRETVEYCKDPHWSPEHQFSIGCSADDGCRAGVPPAEGTTCGPAEAWDDAAVSSWCASLSVPASVAPGEWFDVAVTTSSGICGGTVVWAGPTDAAELDGVAAGTPSGAPEVYDYCYYGTAQPLPEAAGVSVAVPDDWSGSVRFHVPEEGVTEGCVDYVSPEHAPQCCSGGCHPNAAFYGPMAIIRGNGGTHGWTTVRAFDIGTPTLERDDSPL